MLAREDPDAMEGASGLPLRVTGHLLGVPPQDLAQIDSWAEPWSASNASTNPSAVLAGRRALEFFNDYVGGLIDEASEGGQSSPLVAALVQARQEGDLSTDEQLGMFLQLLTGGLETTRTLLGAGLLELLR